jgi:hypothetical protein
MPSTRFPRRERGARRPATTLAAVILAAAGPACAAAAADDEPSTTPYRPSVSTPAALSAPGWLEIEVGVEHDHGDGGTRRDSVPVTLKLAFTPDWGVRIGSMAWGQLSTGGKSLSGFGDTGVVLKRRFAIDDGQAFGLEGGVVLPTAQSGLGEGKASYVLNAIYSADLGDWHTDLNLAATRLDQTDPGASNTVLLWAASLSRPLDDRWGVVGEFSGTDQRGAGSTSQFLLAASYNVSKRLTLDAGAARSLHSASSSWSAFAGLTWLAARLF